MSRLLLLFALFGLTSVLLAEPVRIRGSNGRVIPFDGIREAVDQGNGCELKKAVTRWPFPGPSLIWNRSSRITPSIHQAYVKAPLGEATVLEQGSYERAVVSRVITSSSIVSL